jgi:fatty acyl-CoA reductase
MVGIKDFYADKCILITGTTGFVGKCVLEKILRDLPCVSAIYLLIRPKKGKELADRVMNEILASPIFTRLRSEMDGFEDFFWSKVIPVGGDIGLDGLGLSADSLSELALKLHLIINCNRPTYRD